MVAWLDCFQSFRSGLLIYKVIILIVVYWSISIVITDRWVYSSAAPVACDVQWSCVPSLSEFIKQLIPSFSCYLALQIRFWLPCVFITVISFPSDKIISSSVGCDDPSHKLLYVISFVSWWRSAKCLDVMIWDTTYLKYLVKVLTVYIYHLLLWAGGTIIIRFRFAISCRCIGTGWRIWGSVMSFMFFILSLLILLLARALPLLVSLFIPTLPFCLFGNWSCLSSWSLISDIFFRCCRYWLR